MRTTVTIDDNLYERALELADPDMDKADLFRVAMQSIWFEFSRKASGGLGRHRAWYARHTAAPLEAIDSMSVLIDTSVWVDHFRRSNTRLVQLVTSDQALTHPVVLVELACGTPPAPRVQTLP